jgi:hypothetical protein
LAIVGLVELSGGGARVGTNFDNAIKLAVKEINAGTGLAGRKIAYTPFDTQTCPGVARALAAKAVDSGAYGVMGPVFSGAIIVSMAETDAPTDAKGDLDFVLERNEIAQDRCFSARTCLKSRIAGTIRLDNKNRLRVS